MTQQTLSGAARTETGCDPATSFTRSLLAYGVIAGPIYVVVSVLQALTRTGFDLTRHEWSLLSNGGLGWIQITNFILTGAMTLAFAAGLRRAMSPGSGPGSAPGSAPGATWAPRLMAGYGMALVGAGTFRADPARGFPPGTPTDATAASWPGLLHLACGAVGFAALVAACFVIGRRFAAQARPAWAGFSRATGALFLVGFLAVATGAGSVATTIGFTAAVLLTWTWVSALAVHLYRAAH